MNRIIKKCLNFRLLIIINILVCNIIANNGFCSENFILTTVNKIPITQNDVVNRAKLLSFSIENKSNSKSFKNYYNQSLNTLINEKVILSAGLKINNNIIEMVSPKANQLLLNELKNSKVTLNQLTNQLSIPKATLLERYNSQLIWGIVLKNKFKKQLISLEKQIDWINDQRPTIWCKGEVEKWKALSPKELRNYYLEPKQDQNEFYFLDASQMKRVNAIATLEALTGGM